MKRHHFTDAQARAYIQGEAYFNEKEYEKAHVMMLVEVCKKEIEKGMTEDVRKNFRSTVYHWITLHRDCESIGLLEEQYERI